MNFDFSTLGGKINAGLIVFLLLTVVISALRGIRMRFGRSLWKLIVVACTAALAFATVTTVLSNLGTLLTEEKLNEALATADPQILEKLTEMLALFPNVLALVLALPLSLLAPVLFIVAFLVYSIPAFIVYIIVAVLLFPRRRISRLPFTRLWGFIFGAVRGTVVALVYIFPLLGLSLMVNGAFAKFEASLDGDVKEIADTAAEITETVYDFPGISFLYEHGGEKFFEALTTFSCEIDGKTYKCTMSREVDTFGDIYIDAKPLLDADFANLGEAESAAIKAVAQDVKDSDILRVILAEGLSAICGEWAEGQTPLSIKKPQVDNAQIQQILDGAIDTFKDATPDSVGDDLVAVADTIDVLISHGVFGAFDDPDVLMDLFSSTEFISDLKEAMTESESVKAIVSETAKVGVQSLCSTLIDEENYGDACDEIASAVAGTLNTLSSVGEGLSDAEKKAAQAQVLSETLNAALEDHVDTEDAAVGDAVIDLLAEILVDEFTQGIEDQDVTMQSVLDYLGIGVQA